MTICYSQGDLFAATAQTLAHGVNAAGRIGSGFGDELRLRFPDMYKEYRARCHRRELRPGGAFLWKCSEPWILNLVTQEGTRGLRLEWVRASLVWLATHFREEGIVSVAMPRPGFDPDVLAWEEVRAVIEEVLGPSGLPVAIYEGVDRSRTQTTSELPGDRELAVRPVFFGPLGDPRWRPLSNFFPSPIMVDGREYASVEHYYQACKAVTETDHELIRTAESPAAAKRRGRRVEMRSDWERVKGDVMREGLLAKYQQHPELARVLLSTGHRPIHEDSRWDDVWGWAGGEGQDLLGKILVEIRALLAKG